MDSAGLLIVIAAAAFLLPLIADRLGVPAVVLEILFGILVGPSVVGFIRETELLGFLASLGFFLLMFLSGFEIDFGLLRRKGPAEMGVAFAIFGATLGLAYLASRMLGHGVFMTFVLATTSVGLVVPTLRSARREASEMGQAVLIAAILADFLTLIGVTVFALVRERGGGLPLLNIPILLSVMAAVLLILRRAAWWFPRGFSRLFSEDDPDEVGIRASLALMLVSVGLSELLGVEPILGAFMAGAVVALVFPHRGRLEQKLAGFSYGFLIPVFFITVGLRFEIRALLELDIFLQALALLVAAVLVKSIPALLLLARGLTVRETLAAGLLMSARLSLIIAVAELGVELNLIGEELEAAVILLAIVTTTIAPTVFRRLAPPLPATEKPPS